MLKVTTAAGNEVQVLFNDDKSRCCVRLGGDNYFNFYTYEAHQPYKDCWFYIESLISALDIIDKILAITTRKNYMGTPPCYPIAGL